jgi:hypothetical protein
MGFAVGTGAPERVVIAHLTDERPELCVDVGAPSPIPRLPTPVAAKPCSMPANQRLRTDDVERLHDRRKYAIELEKEPSVCVAQPNSAAALPLQDNHLLTEHRNLGVKARLRCERPHQGCENESDSELVRQYWPGLRAALMKPQSGSRSASTIGSLPAPSRSL